MTTKKIKTPSDPGSSLTFALILLVFLILVIAVSLYFRERIKIIDGQAKTGYHFELKSDTTQSPLKSGFVFDKSKILPV